jgi:hypothetical protein
LKKIASHNFFKKISNFDPLVDPRPKKQPSTSRKLTEHANITKQPQALRPPLYTSHCQKEGVAESMRDTGLTRQGRVPFLVVCYSASTTGTRIHVFLGLRIIVLQMDNFIYMINV